MIPPVPGLSPASSQPAIRFSAQVKVRPDTGSDSAATVRALLAQRGIRVNPQPVAHATHVSAIRYGTAGEGRRIREALLAVATENPALTLLGEPETSMVFRLGEETLVLMPADTARYRISRALTRLSWYFAGGPEPIG